MILSKSLENVGSIDIGLQLFTYDFPPDLKTGITFAILILSGNMLCCSDLLKTCIRGILISS